MNDLEYIKNKDIRPLIEHVTGLTSRKENDLYILEHCPLPDCGSGTGKNHTSAFTIYPGQLGNTFYCFVCGIGGSFIDFIMHYKGLNRKEAIKYIKELLNVTQIPDKEKTIEKPAKDISKQIAAIKQNDKSVATKYLKEKRNINTDLCKGFYYYENMYHPKLRKKTRALIFLDSEEKLINCRAIDYDDPDLRYWNIGKATNTVFDEVFKPDLDSVFITEGVTNCLSLIKYSAISIFSAVNRITDKDKLRKYVSDKTVILAFDADKAGNGCTKYYLKLLSDPYFKIREVKKMNLPDERTDINDLCRQNALQNYLNTPINFTKLYIRNDYQDSFFHQNKESHPKAKNYIRVGTSFYLKGKTVSSKGEDIPELFLWKIGTIRQDFGNIPGFLDMIPKYVSFINVPDNTNDYRREIKGCYNLFEPIKYQPNEGVITNTMIFLNHVFNNKIDVGLDYLSLIYKNPNQNLPVLCLVSKKQKTGKSTFLKWLCEIFGANAIILGNEDFQGKFNSHYASKLIIGIDEGFIDKRLIKEKIKRLATDNRINLEAKGRDIIRMDFFGKFILCSNNEDNFIQMEEEDNRFFVLKLEAILVENPFLLDELRKEIPAFLHYINTRGIIHPHKSRLWFSPDIYETEALKRVVKASRSWTESAMLNWFNDMFGFSDVGDTIYITPKILAEQLKNELRNIQNLRDEVEKIFKVKWELQHIGMNKRFQYPKIGNEFIEDRSTEVIVWYNANGKYYEVTKSFIEEKNE
jgi:hypothetical protein